MTEADRVRLGVPQYNYPSMKALTQATNIPMKVLRLAKQKNAPGFRANSSINYLELEPWLKEHMTELVVEGESEVSLEDLRKEKLTKDIEIADLEIQKRKRMYLDPEDVKGFLTGMAIAQSAVLKKCIKELPPKCAGRGAGEIETILEESILDVFKIFKEGLNQWMPMKK